MVIEADAGLAEHAEERLLAAIFRMVVAADIGHPAGGLAQATLEAICRRDDGTWWRERSDHLQRHHPRETVERALQRAGLRAAAVYGMHLDGSTTDAFDELDNSKAVYVARRRAPESSRAGSP